MDRLGPPFGPAVALRSQPVELQATGLSDSEPHMSIGRGSDVSLWRIVARARFDLMESETRTSFLSWSHFLRKTTQVGFSRLGRHCVSISGKPEIDVRFSGKCSSHCAIAQGTIEMSRRMPCRIRPLN